MKKHFAIFFLMCLGLLIAGCSNDYVWKTTSNGRIWIETKYSDCEYRWEGSTLEGVAHGPGKLVIRKGDKELSEYTRAYYGSFSPESRKISVNNDTIIGALDDEGNITGFAVTISPSGDVCIGNFLKHKPNGYLAFRKNGVTLYRGGWKDGLRDGNAEECDSTLKCKNTLWNKGHREKGQNYSIRTDAGVYVGDISFDDSIPTANGYGKHITTLDTLEGYWEKNTITGPIVYKSKDLLYDGDFFDGEISGLGFFVDKKNNFIYSGSYANGKPSGIGDYYNENGDSYFGEWENGFPNGYGVFKSTKFIYEGTWVNGKINGEGFARYGNGDKYKGEYIDNKRYGNGQYTFKNGDEYVGEFINDKFNGLGYYYSKDGSFYEGEFFNGKFHGDGTLYILTNNDTVAITANWSGNEKKLPSIASILFSNGDLYEGELVNGFPTENGIWSSQSERMSLAVPSPQNNEEINWIDRANHFYKQHKKTWDNVVMAANAVLLAITIAQPESVAITFTAMTVLNVADGLVGAASAAIDLHDSIEAGGDISEASVDLAINAASILLIATAPALSSKAKNVTKPIAKSIMAKLSPSATKIAKSILNIGKKAGSQSVKQTPKIISLVRNINGMLIKKLESSNVGITLNRLVGKERHQFISHDRYRNYIIKNTRNKLELGKEANGQVLKRNMYRCMNKDEQRILAKEKLLSPKGRSAQAHHVVAGNDPLSIKSREILKKCNIDINDPRNGIFLPEHPRSIFKGSIHGNHIADYDKEILERLEAMVKKHGYKEKIAEQVLDDIKRDLYNGSIRLLNKYPKPNTTFSHWKA